MSAQRVHKSSKNARPKARRRTATMSRLRVGRWLNYRSLAWPVSVCGHGAYHAHVGDMQASTRVCRTSTRRASALVTDVRLVGGRH